MYRALGSSTTEELASSSPTSKTVSCCEKAATKTRSYPLLVRVDGPVKVAESPSRSHSQVSAPPSGSLEEVPSKLTVKGVGALVRSAVARAMGC